MSLQPASPETGSPPSPARPAGRGRRVAPLLALLLVLLLATLPAAASETQVRAFRVDLDHLASLVGSNDRAFLDAVASRYEIDLTDCTRRYEYKDGAISGPEALRRLIAGQVASKHEQELRCVLAPALEILGQELSDSSPEMSLHNNMHFWIDDFHPVFEALGLEMLNRKWLADTRALGFLSDSGWPTIAHFDADELSAALAELESVTPDALAALDDELVADRDDDAEWGREVMAGNLAALKSWIEASLTGRSRLRGSKTLFGKPWKPYGDAVGMILVIDGDQ